MNRLDTNRAKLIDDFIGQFAGRIQSPVSIEEMNAMIEQSWAGEKSCG